MIQVVYLTLQMTWLALKRCGRHFGEQDRDLDGIAETPDDVTKLPEDVADPQMTL
jgi:hypothetical protein